jgi:hypothetical protein
LLPASAHDSDIGRVGAGLEPCVLRARRPFRYPVFIPSLMTRLGLAMPVCR